MGCQVTYGRGRLDHAKVPDAPGPAKRRPWWDDREAGPEDDFACVSREWSGFDRQMYALLSWQSPRALTRRLEVMDEFRRAAMQPSRRTWRPPSEWYERQQDEVVDVYTFGVWR